jgi:hypothetical protein
MTENSALSLDERAIIHRLVADAHADHREEVLSEIDRLLESSTATSSALAEALRAMKSTWLKRWGPRQPQLPARPPYADFEWLRWRARQDLSRGNHSDALGHSWQLLSYCSPTSVVSLIALGLLADSAHRAGHRELAVHAAESLLALHALLRHASQLEQMPVALFDLGDTHWHGEHDTLAFSLPITAALASLSQPNESAWQDIVHLFLDTYTIRDEQYHKIREVLLDHYKRTQQTQKLERLLRDSTKPPEDR